MYILYKLYIVYIMYIVYTRTMSKLDILNDYYEINRMVGHSYLSMVGIGLETLPFIYISEDPAMRDQVKKSNPLAEVHSITFISKENLWGLRKPILVDHYSLQLMIIDKNKKHGLEIDELKDRIKELEDELHRS